MKNQTLGCILAVIVTLGLAACTPKSITLEGKVSNLSDNTIVYYSTKDGIYRFTRIDTLFLEADSTYRITIPSEGNEKFSFYVYGKKYLGTVYLAPGKNVLDIDILSDSVLHVENKLVNENKVVKKLARLQDDIFNLRARKGDVFQIAKDTAALSVYQKLIDYGSEMEKEITDVGEVFRKRSVQDIRMQMLMAYLNQYMGIYYRGSEAARQEWEQVYPRMVEYAGLNQPENVFSDAFRVVVSNAAGIEIFMIGKHQSEGMNDSNQRCFEWYEANLEGRVQEVAMANIILEDAMNEKYSSGIPALYEQFKTIHPASILLPDLETAVAKNIAFNKQELPEYIQILNTDSVRTFKEITDRFLGKVVFIDVWATWCGPCRESFAHVKPLQEYAEKNDVVLLYVSIDRPTEVDLWKKMAGYYDLKGNHVVINEAFKMDIYNTFGNNGRLSIPHCAIINKKGELQFQSAASPEDMDKLTGQLQEAAK